MTAGLDTHLIIVVSALQNTAKRIESHLRNAGRPARCAWMLDLDDVEDALRRAAPDLLLCEPDLELVPHDEVIGLCERIAPDLPVVLLAEPLDRAQVLKALRSGARDAVSAEDDDALAHLLAVTDREILNHQHLRELRALRMDLARLESRMRQLMAATADPIAHLHEGIVTGCNESLARMLGHESPSELEGVPVMDLIAPQGAGALRAALRRLQTGKDQRQELELQLLDAEGGSQRVRVILQPEPGDQPGAVQMHVHRWRADDAHGTDDEPLAVPVTPRATLSARLAETAADASGGAPAALLLFRIDDYPGVEQRLGLVDAEALRTTIADLIGSRLQGGELLLPFSDAEIAVIARRPEMAAFSELAESVRRDVAAQIFRLGSHETTASISAVAYPLSASSTPDHVIAACVRRLRTISGEGGNRTETMGEAAEAEFRRQELKARGESIRRAIEQDRLKLAYQLIASLEGDPRRLYDVFVRMIDEGGQELRARDFLPYAEQAGLLRLIDRFVIGKALQRLGRERGEDGPMLFVRISEDTMRDLDQFQKWLLPRLAADREAASRLVIQVQEPIVERNVERSARLAEALAEAGTGLALDYFGLSPTAESLLDHIPATFVKFHPEFTERFREPEIAKRLRALLQLAHQRRIKSVVAQVEHAEVMAQLWQLGVNYVQGYSVQEPEVVMLQADITLSGV